jgi:hypothetical protein
VSEERLASLLEKELERTKNSKCDFRKQLARVDGGVPTVHLQFIPWVIRPQLDISTIAIIIGLNRQILAHSLLKLQALIAKL